MGGGAVQGRLPARVTAGGDGGAVDRGVARADNTRGGVDARPDIDAAVGIGGGLRCPPRGLSVGAV